MNTNWTEHWKSNESFIARKGDKVRTDSYQKLFSKVELKNPNILEFGSGTAKNSLLLSKLFNAKEISLVDNNDAALKISKKTFKNTKSKVNFIKKAVFKYKSSKKFDIVHSEGLVEHFFNKDRDNIFKIHADNCKKGGYVAIFAPYISLKYKLLVAVLTLRGEWIYDEKPFTVKELREQFQKNNLRIIKEYKHPFNHEIGILGIKE